MEQLVTATPDPHSLPFVMLNKAEEPATRLPLDRMVPLLRASEGERGAEASTVSNVAEVEQFPMELHSDVLTQMLPSSIEEKLWRLFVVVMFASRIVVPLLAYSTDMLRSNPLFHPLDGVNERVKFSEM